MWAGRQTHKTTKTVQQIEHNRHYSRESSLLYINWIPKVPNYVFLNVSKAATVGYCTFHEGMNASRSLFHCSLLTLDLSLSSCPLCVRVSLCQVEQFKQDPSPTKCLHSVFHVDTGDEVHTYSEYHHLQVSPQLQKSIEYYIFT